MSEPGRRARRVGTLPGDMLALYPVTQLGTDQDLGVPSLHDGDLHLLIRGDPNR
jgi:hypothetical protein